MSKTISLDLRRRVAAMVDAGHSARASAAILVSVRALRSSLWPAEGLREISNPRVKGERKAPVNLPPTVHIYYHSGQSKMGRRYIVYLDKRRMAVFSRRHGFIFQAHRWLGCQ